MDDYDDNYVPQISTMDWQNLERETENIQVRVAPAIGSTAGSGSFLYDVSAQPVAGTSYRSFPGMGIMPEQPFIGVASYGSGQCYQPNNFSSDVARSQPTFQQQSHQQIRTFNPLNPSYITDDTQKQNVLQHGMISGSSNPIAKSTKVSKKCKKTAVVDSNMTHQSGFHSVKPMSTHQTQIHNTQHCTNVELTSCKNNRGPGSYVSYSLLDHAATQFHQPVVDSPNSEFISLHKDYSLQPDGFGSQNQFPNVQNNVLNGTEQARIQNYNSQHLRSYNSQPAASLHQEKCPMLVQPQQKIVASSSVQNFENDDYISKQQYIHVGNNLPHKEAVMPIVGYPNAYQAGCNMHKQGSLAEDFITGHGHHQFYLSNQYNDITRQHHQYQRVYRELYECDQQLSTLLSQVQQNPELSTSVEKLQMRKQYLHSQLMQISYAMNTPPVSYGSNMNIGPARLKESQQSSTSHLSASSQFLGPYPTHLSQQKLVYPNFYPYPTQQNFIHPHVSAHQLHPKPPIPPAPLHSNVLGTNLSMQPMSPHPDMTQQHQPMVSLQQFLPPLPNISSPSVSVMSAPNVQVNIRPEFSGRTLISVYHGQDIRPNLSKSVNNSVQMHYDTPATDIQNSLNYESQQHYRRSNDRQLDPSSKDSIPPEPLPPNLAREHRLRQQQQKLKQQETFTENVQRAFPSGAENRLPSPPSPPTCITNVSLCFFSCDETTENFSKTLPICLNEEVEATFEAPQLELNPHPRVETKVLDSDPDYREPEQTTDDIVKDVEITELTYLNQLEPKSGSLDRSNVDGKFIQDIEDSNIIINKEEPEQQTKICDDHISDLDAIILKGDSKEKLEDKNSIEIGCEKFGEIQYLTEENFEEIYKTDEKAETDPCNLDILTNEPIDNVGLPFSFQTTSTGTDSHKTFAETRKSRKSIKSRGMKRKIDWNKDDDYIGTRDRKQGINKSASGKKKYLPSVPPDETFPGMSGHDNALLIGKRSSRKRVIGRKTQYADESEYEEDIKSLLLEQQESSESRIVEKILGIRFTKRKINIRMEEEQVPEAKLGSDKIICTVSADESFSVMCDSKPDISETILGKEDSLDIITSEKDTNTEELILDDKGAELDTKDSSVKHSLNMDSEQLVEEIYVKFKGFSYVHCEWKTIHELEVLGDKRITSKLNRWKQKFRNDSNAADVQDDDEVFFNDDYIIVSRVLDETYDKKERQQYVFVKWKSLPYEESTWELEKDVPKCKLLDFRRRAEFDLFKLKDHPKISPEKFSSHLAIPKDRIYNNGNVLREYQHEGVNWLLWTWINSRNCILADEMGLGKTVQSIVFLLSLYDIGVHGPFLIVVPLSTLGNWEREFAEWAPEINAIVYHGSALSRKIIRDYEFFYKKVDGRRRNVPKFDALITTYEVVVQEVEVLRRINFRVCVIDEAHRIKNRNCKLLQSGLLSLRMDYRVLLTGTPLQNNIQELFSLLNFLEPEQFANSEAFLQQFGQCQTEEQVQKLQEILKPMMLRRLKEDVEKELQPKEETIIEVQLSNIQKKYYRAVLERNFTHLMKGTTPSLINTMMQLRKCCCHPYLINGAEEQILNELKHLYPEKSEEERQVFGLISSSGKVVLIDKLLPKLRADGHRVLIFSQMVKVLDLLEEYLNIKCYPYERIDGNIRGNERQAAIDRFSKPENKDCFIFLLCTRAGGLGINLTAADTVIIFDSDWNPQNDLQAQARCHRIGQTKQVKIYRLITANTYEREMFDKASLKLGLDKAVLQSMRTECNLQNSHQLTRQEVEDLLRKGAYGAIMDEDNEGTRFGEEDIETILERRAQTIKLEAGVKGSTFAKASFTVSHNRDDIDVSDPDFWSKWAKKANIDVGVLHDDYSTKHLIIHEPRARKKRFEEEIESADDGVSDDGTSRIAENVKSRSVRKKRRGASSVGTENDFPFKANIHPQDKLSLQIPSCSQHPELSCTITQLKKVEKLLMQYGWGRWSTFKQFFELDEQELEHISRTLLLHCVREFRGDEKIQEFIWKLITPPDEESDGLKMIENGLKISDVDSKSKFYQGWAQKPEYNPPFICVDIIFQRHLHRNASKLLNRIHALQGSNVIAETKETSIENQSDNEKRPTPFAHSSEKLTLCNNEESIAHKKEKKILENSDNVTKAKELLLKKQSTIAKQKDATTELSSKNSSITNSSERSSNKISMPSQNEYNKMMGSSEYLLQLLHLMGYCTDDNANTGVNSLMKPFITSSPSTSSTNNATLTQQLQNLLALTSLSSASDFSNITNSALTTALASFADSHNSSVNTIVNRSDSSISGKSNNSKRLQKLDLLTREKESLPKIQLNIGKQSVITPPTSTHSFEKSTSVANKPSISLNDYTKLMSNPQYMLQLLALMGYSTENSLNIGMNSLFAVPSSSSSATYNAALQNQQLQTLLALSSLSGSTDLNNAINSSYLSAALVSMLGTNCPSVNIGDNFSKFSPNSGIDDSTFGKFDNLKKLDNQAKRQLPSKQSIHSTQSATRSYKAPDGCTSVNNASLTCHNELTKMMSNPQYMLQLLAMMGYGTETNSSVGMNLLTSSSSSSATYSAALQNQQLQALIALTSLTGTPDLNNVVNSSYLSAAVAAMIGSSTSVSNKGQKKQDIQSNSLTGQKKTHKVDDATATNIPK